MKRKTNEEFLKQAYDLVGDEYTFLETYKNNYTKLKIRHNTCKHEYCVRPNSFLDGNGRCSKMCKKKI